MSNDTEEERASVRVSADPPPELTEEQIARLEAENGLRQVDVMLAAIETAVSSGSFRLRPSVVADLQKPAVLGIEPDAGYFRQGEVRIQGSNHVPPGPHDVLREVEAMCDYVNESWGSKTAVHLAAYIMWRHNWIHPFSDGNGRTSRTVSYLVLCAHLGYRVPGAQTMPERIAGNKRPYYDALDHADERWAAGVLDVSQMEALVEQVLADQLIAVHEAATGKTMS